MHDHHRNFSALEIGLPVFLLLFLLTAYFAGVHQLRKSGKDWKQSRTIFFCTGIGLCLLALSPPVATFAHHDLRGHMIQHLLLGMLAPLGLVLGAPITLLLRIVPVKKGRKITAFLGSRKVHYISHPITALLLNIGGMYLLYLSPLYAAMQSRMWLHYILHFHFLAAGYLFTWSIAGPDPAPGRPSFRLRLLVLFFSMATHAYLSKFMFAYQYPRNTTHSITEIEEAAMWMYYGGDLSELLLAIAFFAMWYNRKAIVSPALQALRN